MAAQEPVQDQKLIPVKQDVDWKFWQVPFSRQLLYPLPFWRDLRGTPALCKAIATACFFGRPAAISVLMFAAIAALLLPFLSGIMPSL